MKKFDMELTLYHCPQSRSDRALWALHELGLAEKTTLHSMDLMKGANQNEKYAEMNGMRQVPTLAMRDSTNGQEYFLTESSAIPLFLAETTGSDLQPLISNTLARAQYYRMIALASSSVDQMVSAVVFNEKVAPMPLKDPVAAAKGRNNFKEKVVGVFERIFTAKDGEDPIEWICEPFHKGFTVADCIVGYTLILADFVNLLDDSPILKAYITRCRERPAYQAMCNSENYISGTVDLDIPK